MDCSKIVPPLKLILRRDSTKSLISPPYDKPSTSHESAYAPELIDRRKTEFTEENLPAIENEAADMHETAVDEAEDAELSPIEWLKRINNSQAAQLIELHDEIDQLRRKFRDQDAKLTAGKNFNDYLQRALEREKTARQLDKQASDAELAKLKEEHTRKMKKCELEKEKIQVHLSEERQKMNAMSRSEWEFGQRIAREHMNSGMPLFLEGFIRGALEHPSLANILAENGQIPIASSIPSTSSSSPLVKDEPESRKRGGAGSEVSATKGKKIKSEIHD